MFKLAFTGQFNKDYKKIVKGNYDIDKLFETYHILEKTGTLPVNKYKTQF